LEDILDRGILREDVYRQEVEPLIASLDEIRKQQVRLGEDFEKEGILNLSEVQKGKELASELDPAAEQLESIKTIMGELKSALHNISGKSLVREDIEGADKIARALKDKEQKIDDLHDAFKGAAGDIFGGRSGVICGDGSRDLRKRERAVRDKENSSPGGKDPEHC
jgi:seryl-tRNA synthetase